MPAFLYCLHFDAQKYSSSSANFTSEVYYGLYSEVTEKRPVILVVEELDKIKEVTTSIDGREETSPLIGTLNQIVSDGIISYQGSILKVSNVFVITTMNFSPQIITEFTSEVLRTQKSFYDMTLDELLQFTEWVQNSPAARYKMLSKVFRTNTVGRLAPNIIVMNALMETTYRAIAELQTKETIKRMTVGENAKKRIQVAYDNSYIDFLFRTTVYAPSGARETVIRVDSLTEQLVNLGVKGLNGQNENPDTPRKILIQFDPDAGEAILTITPMLLKGRALVEGKAFQVRTKYKSGTRLFAPISNRAENKPSYPAAGTKDVKITNKMVQEMRFPKSLNLAKGLDEAITSQLVAQDDLSKIILDDLNRYLSRPGPAKKEPSYRALAGFPGLGKSDLVKIVAEYLKIPLIKINMQQFSSDSPDTVSNFFQTVDDLMKQHDLTINSNKPYIFLLEELDKVFELDPTSGRPVNRPIMGVVKDLLNEGFVSNATTSGHRQRIDIRGAFSFLTMNFSVDRFKFDADPRLTTVEDVIKAWKKMSMTPMAIKSVLGTIFLPETVSRLMARLSIIKPPDRNEYKKLIQKQVDRVIRQRMFNSKGQNVAQITIELSPRYLDYLFRETVVPSEGARHTVVSAGALIASDLEDTLSQLPRSSKYGTKPLTVKLDYLPSKTSVVSRIRLQSEDAKMSRKILEKPVALNFPPLDVTGKLKEERILVSAHKFGHAFINTRLGLRLETVVVASPSPGVGGYVKNAGPRFLALEQMALIYSLLGSRAFERIVMNENPLSPDSVLRITAGARTDIKMASQTLFEMLYELGFDPEGGVIDRNFVNGPVKYADMASVPPEVATKMGLILREMEDRMVEDLMKTHSRDWYVEKIAALAHKGSVSEEEFYQLIEAEFPGETAENFGTTTHLRHLFQRHTAPRKLNKKSFTERYGQQQRTVEENMDLYMEWFATALKNHLHNEESNLPHTPSCTKFLLP